MFRQEKPKKIKKMSLEIWQIYLDTVQNNINAKFMNYDKNFKSLLMAKSVCLLRISSEKKIKKSIKI